MREYIQNKEYINLCERKYIMKNFVQINYNNIEENEEYNKIINTVVKKCFEEEGLDNIKIYSVEKDEQDIVARQFLDKNKKLSQFFETCEYKLRQKNISIYNQKQRKKQSRFLKIIRKISIHSKKIFPEYKHNNVISDMVR